MWKKAGTINSTVPAHKPRRRQNMPVKLGVVRLTDAGEKTSLDELHKTEPNAIDFTALP